MAYRRLLILVLQLVSAEPPTYRDIYQDVISPYNSLYSRGVPVKSFRGGAPYHKLFPSYSTTTPPPPPTSPPPASETSTLGSTTTDEESSTTSSAISLEESTARGVSVAQKSFLNVLNEWGSHYGFSLVSSASSFDDDDEQPVWGIASKVGDNQPSRSLVRTIGNALNYFFEN